MKDLKKIKINFGDRNFNAKIISEKRKNLKITVYPDKEVIIKSPENKSEPDIVSHLKKKANWILKQIDYFDQFHPLPIQKKFVSGETHYYLGKQYRLKIIKNDFSNVKLKGKFFFINTPYPQDSILIKQILGNWYKEHAKIILKPKIQFYLNKFELFSKYSPSIYIRIMKKRWGSCSKNGNITLNVELIKTKSHLISYVIVHELCHLIYPNHSKDFFRLLSTILPDWESKKRELEKQLY